MITKVLIVAKTRQGTHACIGGITYEGQSVRLVAADAAVNEHAGMDYAVGEVWEVDLRPAEKLVPPHVENVVVWSKRRLGLAADPISSIEQRMPPVNGGIEALFSGLALSGSTGALYITERGGVPSCSTMFWRPDQPLQRSDDGKRIRYRYPAAGGGRTLVFVGFQEPIETIPAGTLLRVSLAHWWRPEEDDDGELRCYVQLSGWCLPSDSTSHQPMATVVAGVSPATAARAAASASAVPPRAPGEARKLEQQADRRVAPDRAPASQLQPGSPGMGEAQRLLKTVFGYDTFRSLQAQIVANLLAKRDTLAIMPTGSGKSLCYQLPALLFDGLTVVVSPLISLMQDQVNQLLELGAPAVFLNSTLDYGAYRATTERVKRGEVKLLYTSPETLLRPETLVMLDRCQVNCLAIDEAHCISAWGHDFRPEYRQLLSVRQRYPGAVCVAFTATATARVRRDISEMLGFRHENEFVARFDRENLYLAVQPRTDGLAQTLAFLNAHRNASGIIYCSTRAGVDRLTTRLAAKGWGVLPYHAGMSDEDRRRNQDAFSRDRTPIIVATIAFGMGINKSNVRFVLHYNLPQSIESYYQEIGRAGRDGLRADCLLLYSPADRQTIYGFIEEGAERERAGRHARLEAMTRYAEADGCRRAVLLPYFGEEPAALSCGFCDNCLAVTEAQGEKVEVSDAARRFLTCVKLTGQMFGSGHIIDVLRGSQAARVLSRHHDRLSVYGTGRDLSSAEWKRLGEQFIRQGLAKQDMEHGGLQLTEKGQAVLAGGQVFVTAVVRTQPVAAPGPEMAYDAALFERLRALRREIAEENNVPPYVVFSDRSLIEMATYFPASENSFLAIHGVGERKLAQYGGRFLAVIGAYSAEQGLSERPRSSNASPSVARATQGRSAEVGDRFAAGHSIVDLQAMYGVTQGTIVNHLYQGLRAGRGFPAERILEVSTASEADRRRALASMAELGTDALRPIYDAVEGSIPFDELHILRLYYLCLK
jgi:ATP-dependent DNA helicase RecQ